MKNNIVQIDDIFSYVTSEGIRNGDRIILEILKQREEKDVYYGDDWGDSWGDSWGPDSSSVKI